jgi:hypothetical protein
MFFSDLCDVFQVRPKPTQVEKPLLQTLDLQEKGCHEQTLQPFGGSVSDEKITSYGEKSVLLVLQIFI